MDFLDDFVIGPQSDEYEQMWDEEWDAEMAEFEEEFEPGRSHWDEMAANP